MACKVLFSSMLDECYTNTSLYWTAFCVAIIIIVVVVVLVTVVIMTYVQVRF